MAGAQDPYSCLYWRVKADPRFEHAFGCDACWAAYTRLLMDAEASYPAPASIPSHLKPHARTHLLDAGIIELRPHDCFIVHGLQKEREKRAEQGRENALKGWEKRRGGTPMPPQRPAIADPMLTTHSNASHSNAVAREETITESLAAAEAHPTVRRPRKRELLVGLPLVAPTSGYDEDDESYDAWKGMTEQEKRDLRDQVEAARREDHRRRMLAGEEV